MRSRRLRKVVEVAVEEAKEGVVLLLEAVVESLGDSFHVESRANPAGNIDDGDVVFLVQSEDEVLQFLDQCLARLVPMIDVQT